MCVQHVRVTIKCACICERVCECECVGAYECVYKWRVYVLERSGKPGARGDGVTLSAEETSGRKRVSVCECVLSVCVSVC